MPPRRWVPLLSILTIVLGTTVATWPVDSAQAKPGAGYFPARGAWEKREPAAVGLDKAKIDEAIALSIKNENPRTKNLAEDIPATFRNEAPYNTVDGPTQERTGMNGVIIYKGYAVAEWGDTNRSDMTFSVTKSFLSTVVGLAYDRKLIKDLNDRVGPYMPKGVDLFTSEHNAPITWDHLLRQTSDWYGELWGQPDWADRPSENGATPADWPKRPRRAPGTHYKYNDVRVNVLSLATLHVMKKPLPVVLKESIMDPIGASNTWRWEPYNNAYVTIDGQRMPSVPGGGHHGGGMFISAWDMARFGYLFLRNGNWNGKQLISEKWIGLARTPGTALNDGSKTYGFMNWGLNVPSPRGTKSVPAAPPTVVQFSGNGANLIYIDWENDLVIVVRWIQRGAPEFFGTVLAAIKK
jgi:CubicO group peptidase (beta-lactamase class C family)